MTKYCTFVIYFKSDGHKVMTLCGHFVVLSERRTSLKAQSGNCFARPVCIRPCFYGVHCEFIQKTMQTLLLLLLIALPLLPETAAHGSKGRRLSVFTFPNPQLSSSKLGVYSSSFSHFDFRRCQRIGRLLPRVSGAQLPVSRLYCACIL